MLLVSVLLKQSFLSSLAEMWGDGTFSKASKNLTETRFSLFGMNLVLLSGRLTKYVLWQFDVNMKKKLNCSWSN